MYKVKRKFQTVYVDNKMVKSLSTYVSKPLLYVIIIIIIIIILIMIIIIIYYNNIIITRRCSRLGIIANFHAQVFDPQHPQVTPLVYDAGHRMNSPVNIFYIFL